MYSVTSPATLQAIVHRNIFFGHFDEKVHDLCLQRPEYCRVWITHHMRDSCQLKAAPNQIGQGLRLTWWICQLTDLDLEICDFIHGNGEVIDLLLKFIQHP